MNRNYPLFATDQLRIVRNGFFPPEFNLNAFLNIIAGTFLEKSSEPVSSL
jgi:hypothetical protein